MVIETGQYFIPERHPSVTDVLIGALGAWLAFHLLRHVVNALEPGPAAVGEGRYYYGANLRHSSVPGPPQRPREGSAGSSRLPNRPEGPLEALSGWLVQQPYWLAVTLLCVAAVVLVVGLVLLLNL
jgi:hypothetical protein